MEKASAWCEESRPHMTRLRSAWLYTIHDAEMGWRGMFPDLVNVQHYDDAEVADGMALLFKHVMKYVCKRSTQAWPMP